ncbi:ATP-binding protein [Pyxidicoccus parkwayensis]|uniref:ATP-binding protein n=1 Tax=Pyxidicoccus parkwayensis TaxID=2813578 RepID=A0ABX7NTV7_9BACT|nr:ATP-binding protein [Pyxidicoccus parkwaysis]QSQ19568.1 ATP-binding protein [Pyxidicoccus parkwaysis]
MTAVPTPAQPAKFNLQPHPRILPMLGEINLPQWRCIAELVDNSIDGFLRAQREGQAIVGPEIHVSLPTTSAVGAKVSIRDNGPGMSSSTLENAVKAGWTSNDPINNLGLFGMGFNIATAKLGRITTVWTARPTDGEWTGVRIDFDALTRNGDFLTDVLTRAKIDPLEHGTEVTIESLKADQLQWLAKTANRSQLMKHLAEAYSAMLRAGGRPLEFSLSVNSYKVPGHQQCVWGSNGSPTREVILPPPLGTVSAFQAVDVSLPPRPFCQSCWQWLAATLSECPTCGETGSVVSRTRRVHGWLGVQRYLHEAEFGIDFLRNGRKIEVKSKELFDWTNPDGSVEKEYPIDDHRRLGRLVGEIHVDHCRVSYMKDRFERTDPAWEEMLRIVRGDGPLRPEVAKSKQFDPTINTSPLFKLYQAFRRSSPYKKVPGCYKKLLLVPPEHNAQASKMAEKFRAGDPIYSTDAKWWELVEEADSELLKGAVPPGQPPGTNPPPSAGPAGNQPPLPGFGGTTSPIPAAKPNPQAQPPAAPVPIRSAIRALTQEYRETSTGQTYNIRAFEVSATDPDLVDPKHPWRLKADPSGVFQFLVNPSHAIFQSATMTPLDALLTQLAWAITDYQRSIKATADFDVVLANLREAYGAPSKIDSIALSTSAASVLSAIGRTVSKELDASEGAALFKELTEPEQNEIIGKMVTRQVSSPKSLIGEGKFLEFASRQTLIKIFSRFPELFFDGRCWEDSFSTLDLPTAAATEQAKGERVRYYSGLLLDALWLAECDPSALAEASRPRLLRSALALELLTPDED